MRTHFAKMVGAVMLCMAFGAEAQQPGRGQEVLKVELSNFPRYGREVTSKEHLDALSKSGRELAQELKAGKKLWVFVIGHADFDAKGREFEKEISRQRAKAARDVYEVQFKGWAIQERLTRDQISHVEFMHFGVGTCCPVVPKPKSETDRKKNRRVKIFWGPQFDIYSANQAGQALADRVTAEGR